MATLPGWSHEALAAATTRQVEAARAIAYAHALRGTVTVDIEGALERLALSEIVNPKAADRARKSANAKHREELRTAQREQVRIRQLLELDEPDDPDEAE